MRQGSVCGFRIRPAVVMYMYVDQMVQYVQFVVACYGSVYSIDYLNLMLRKPNRKVRRIR